ncbi:HEPN domain-containing protein [Phenylobacterium sp. 58.2.17]|uniref:HEPN domain-containing protein n=1 Tax=Phenylobacterium sp. 58.2.17 TaxID=2969306 RepID=UPI002263BA5A|nr:HEPN domain-containing protein [Phenylobacterium sp. 58.2.17]MCX7587276.1 HEPN domain-containing protein [Phenylobacterium sp. 58.2.17]
MKTRLDHLPAGKRHELEFVIEVLREGFAEAISRRTMPRFKNGRILKVILFGSYARGDWVEDPVGRYFSDYDLLVVVSHEDLADLAEFWDKTEKRLLKELASGEKLRTQPSLVVHSLDDVNEKLKLGRYFFIDILSDGIELYAEPGHPFVSPQPLSPQDALAETKEYFAKWFSDAAGLLDTAHLVQERGRLNETAFHYHQAAEKFYHCLLLVLTLYSPKTHRMNRLRDLAEELDGRLIGVWPGSNKIERRCYDLLRRAYVEARYSPRYKITAEELAWLDERITLLQGLVREICEERIRALESQVG